MATDLSAIADQATVGLRRPHHHLGETEHGVSGTRHSVVEETVPESALQERPAHLFMVTVVAAELVWFAVLAYLGITLL